MEDRTAEQLASDYTAMGHSIELITDVIAGDCMADEDAANRNLDNSNTRTKHLR
jgi:hypothetical protein